MRLGKSAVFAVVTGTMTLGLAAPAMADTTGVTVTPGKVRPGQQVTVHDKNCDEDGGRAGSLGFKGGSIPMNGAEEVEGRAGLATISPDATGTYTVQVICGTHKAIGHYEVVNGKWTDKGHKNPSGGAKTGVGGGAGGDSTALLAGGGLLVLGAAGIGTLAARRRTDAAA